MEFHVIAEGASQGSRVCFLGIFQSRRGDPMMSRIQFLATLAVALATLARPSLPAADGNATPDAREYVLTVEGMT